MSYPVYNKESVSYPVYNKEIDTPIQPYDSSAKRKKNEDLEITAIDNEERLRVAKGIVYALIFCIPFWILLIKVVVWLT
jgi:hypothetical protein